MSDITSNSIEHVVLSSEDNLAPQFAKKKSLYDKRHRYTREARILEDQVIENLRHLFNKQIEMGYSPREISHVFHASVDVLESEIIMED